MSLKLYSDVCSECSEWITKRYSTSFTMGIKAFHKKFRKPIYNIYGFVRFADEIVDTFHDKDKTVLLEDFRVQTFKALEDKISLNPVLQAFQETVHEYNISHDLIEAFLDSMAMDLKGRTYDIPMYKKYIYGSAEVIGLMCLHVFVEGNNEEYQKLSKSAKALGSAFQKINFLRDIKSDFEERGRVYFPGVEFEAFTEQDKLEIELDIYADFKEGYEGIKQLPKGTRYGVFLAYIYYYKLFLKIKGCSVERLISSRIRIPNVRKISLLFSSAIRVQLNML